ncbi:MAG: hypothetical protein HQK98_01555 [Nitrospirae bacterium]|nr:hypothetical protein [Nitrospirota bacterium]
MGANEQLQKINGLAAPWELMSLPVALQALAVWRYAWVRQLAGGAVMRTVAHIDRQGNSFGG